MMNGATTNLSGLHLSTLIVYHRDASDSAAVALPGTKTHAVRVAWLGKIAGELGRRGSPVCPRCLDLEPGTPGGTPETPHPGPFAQDLCAPCELRSR
jgi:hypothetical protein